MDALRHANDEFTFPDRLLAHLQPVFTAKMRRGERFLFTWDDPVTNGGQATQHLGQ